MRILPAASLAAAFTAVITLASVKAEVAIGLSAPLTGTYAWVGLGAQDGVRLALEDLSSEKYLLGERVELITVDDYCDHEQAIAAAHRLVEASVSAVFGPLCSGAAIPASEIFAEAGILMISPSATNPALTEQGFRTVFRVIGRDDVQGKIAADLLAQRWGNDKIAILHDGEIYGKGLASEVKKHLNQKGVIEVMFESVAPRKADYTDVVLKLKSKEIRVIYYAGYATEAALLIRQARAVGLDLQLVGGDALSVEDFRLIAGTASEGTLFTTAPDPKRRPDAAAVASRVGRPGALIGTLMAYAAVEAWAQAVAKAGSFETAEVSKALRASKFDTILGEIGFDEKGDVTGYDPFVWYVWKGETQIPLAPGALNE
jgi:branched-chain amino acid transport system substrate-binding protein